MFTNNQINVGDLPKVEELQLESIHPKYLIILVINICSFIGIAMGGISLARYFSEDDSIIRVSGVSLLLIGLLGILVLTVYYLGFKNRKYAIREKDMTYTHGFIVKKQITLPYNRIQHLEIRRPFLARKLGLSTLKIYSAGESGGDLAIKGLPKDVAEQQYAYLTQIINERV